MKAFRIATLIALVACSERSEPGVSESPIWVRVVGQIEGGAQPPDPLPTPGTVSVGAPFQITVTTYGGCVKPAGATVQVSDLVAEITPYDSVPFGGPPCPPVFMSFPRIVELQFSATGQAVVRLHGRGFSGPLTVEKPITVVP
jgi:hypothetical protein